MACSGEDQCAFQPRAFLGRQGEYRPRVGALESPAGLAPLLLRRLKSDALERPGLGRVRLTPQLSRGTGLDLGTGQYGCEVEPHRAAQFGGLRGDESPGNRLARPEASAKGDDQA